MNVLIANDDGIRAEGIKRLAGALSGKANIYVFAPDSQRSAAGHGITMNREITCTPVAFPGADEAFMVDGTPADCVKLGMRIMESRGVDIDMVFSGINHGSNVGTDTLYSGTVSAAIEGNLCGVPAAAVSVASHDAEHFDMACRLAVSTLEKGFMQMDRMTTLNINTPNEKEEDIKGVKITRLGIREYDNWLDEIPDENGTLSFRYSGEPVKHSSMNAEIDVIALQAGYATITPLMFDLTNHHLFKIVKEWGLSEL
jgi:5'-nucleotidase